MLQPAQPALMAWSGGGGTLFVELAKEVVVMSWTDQSQAVGAADGTRDLMLLMIVSGDDELLEV